MEIVEKVYGENGIYNKLKIINSTNFQLKDSYQSVIPLNLYLTWSNKELPEKMHENVIRIIKNNPEFKVEIYDCNERREFIKNNFNENVLYAYDNLIPGAYKADLWRLCILYKNGGIYLDIKLNCINNFKFIALTEKEHLCLDRPGCWKPNEIGIYNAIIISKPNNKLLLRCINKIVENVKNRYYCFNDLYPTGPGLLGEEYIKMIKEKNLDIDDELKKINICMDKEILIFNNIPIIKPYKEYRDEQKLFAKTKTYGDLYNLLQIYAKDLKENFINIVSDFNKNIENFQNTNLFTQNNLIILLVILIIMLMLN